LTGHLSFQIPDEQNKEWFIVALLPHIKVPLMQQKVVSQAEALEISMKLEATPVGESSPGMSQILNRLTSLSLQVEDMKKDKGKEKICGVSDVNQKAMTKRIIPYFMNTWPLEHLIL
jgi:hypothetical protein